MAKKSVRLFSLLLSVLMLVSMIPVVATAEYDYDAASAPKDYVTIPYDGLVGTKYQNIATNVYIVDTDWNFAAGKAPKTVTFNFRNKEVTENYDPTRHLTSIADVYAQSKIDNPSQIPICILTEGNYSDSYTLSGSIYILGARAGMNPNVPNNDPSKKWDLSSERDLAAYTSSDSKGETRFWIEGAIDVGAGYGGAGSSYTKKIFTNGVNGANSANFVFDGVVFQGYGAVIQDSQSGTGMRSYTLQNCILNNGWSYDCSTLRLWNRGCNAIRNLYVSNCYATGYKQLGFYSGQAMEVKFNGLVWQDNYAGLCYDVEHIGQLGLNFELKNSHFWNSEAVSSTATLGSMFHYDRIFYSDFNQGSSNAGYVGTNTEAYRYTIQNNTFWNMERVSGGSFATSYNLFEIPMGGENELVTMENNIFGNTMANVKRHPLQIRYLTVGGVPSHAAEVPALSDATTLYALTNDNIQVNNNTFIGKAYTNLTPDIGSNSCPDTKVEMTGNFYTTSLSSNVGTYVAGNFTDNIYDKWVWVDNSEAGMQDPKNRTDYINESAFSLGGLNLNATVDPEDPYSYTIDLGTKTSALVWANADTTVGNVVQWFRADEDFNKVEQLTSTSLTAPERKNYYVAALSSIDRRTTIDYKITVVRNVFAGCELAGIKEEAYPEMVITSSNETGPDVFTYNVDNGNKEFSFALDVADTASTVVYGYNSRGLRYQLSDNGTANNYTVDLDKTNTVYTFDVEVTASGKTEVYSIEISRGLSSAADVESVIINGENVVYNEATDSYDAETEIGAAESTFEIAVSEGATFTVTDLKYNRPITAKNGVYTVNQGLGVQSYLVAVTSQDGETTNEYTINIERPASTAKDILEIAGATKDGDAYTVEVESTLFVVNATVSPAATYAIYADEACTEEIRNAQLTLTEIETTVWLVVTAEDGSESDPVALTITTSAITDLPEVEPGMSTDGVIAISGDAYFTGPFVIVNLGEEAKSYDFKIYGLGGHEVRVFADSKMTLWAPTEMNIVPDAGATLLYATATKDDVTTPYVIMIVTTVPVEFTDKDANHWASGYVEALEDSDMGFLKGDHQGKLNGENNLNRYEMAAMMVRINGVNKDLYKDVKLPFKDSIVDWATNYVKAAYRIGLIAGHAITDSTGAVTGYEFKGDDYATRSEFAKVFVNAVYGEDITEYYNENKTAIDKAVNDRKFADIKDVADWAVPYVYTAVYDGIIKGTGTGINPNGKVTRYEAAAMICRVMFEME